VVAAPSGRCGEDGVRRPTAVVCRQCGHEEALGVLFGRLSPEAPSPADVTEMEARVARKMTTAARSAPFELYGLAGHQPTVASHRSNGGVVDSVSLSFDTPAGRVTVETSAKYRWESTAGLACQAFEYLLHERDSAWPEGSETAMLLWLTGRHRTHAADSAAAPASELVVPVDREPTSFTTVAHGERFAAVGHARNLTITLAGHGDPADLALNKLDPSAIDGPPDQPAAEQAGLGGLAQPLGVLDVGLATRDLFDGRGLSRTLELVPAGSPRAPQGPNILISP
jgi:hypothetical protein